MARAESREALIAFLAVERVDPYQEGQWSKVYRKGGPLEWYNEPLSLEEAIVDAGTVEDWKQSAIEFAIIDYQQKILSVPEVSTLQREGSVT